MHDYSLLPKIEYKKRPRKKAPIFGVLILIFFLIGIIFLPKKFTQNKNMQSDTSTLPTVTSEVKKPQLPPSSQKDLLSKIEAVLDSSQGTYSVYIYDLNTNQGFGINEHTQLTAASVNKIPILATLYHQAGEGKIDLENDITVQAKDMQSYGTGIIHNAKPGTKYSLKTLARLMMEKSDNTAAYILGSQVLGLDQIQEYINSLGLTQTDMLDNKTSNADMANLMVKIYRGEISNQALNAEMLDFMDKSDFDDRIPKELPENIKTYHKTGDEVGRIHDVGIIDLPNHPYFLGILTIDMTEGQQTKENLAKISRLVYEYMIGNR